MFTDDSDYIVEQYVKPQKVRKPLINDERADLLGNFDDDDLKFKSKKKPTQSNETSIDFPSEEDPFADAVCESEDEPKDTADNADEQESDQITDNDTKSDTENDDAVIENALNETQASSSKNRALQPAASKTKAPTDKSKKLSKNPHKSSTSGLTDDQVQALIRGCSKKDRFVLYVTNLNYSTTRESLSELFSAAGPVKSVRVPKVRRSAFAFVEMCDISGFKNALTFHNRTLDNYTIKVQISEAGKKKSANKKNILKQKNRKLAEMRNEGKQFQRSGKGYDKTIKKEIHQRKMQQNRRLARKEKSKNQQSKK